MRPFLTHRRAGATGQLVLLALRIMSGSVETFLRSGASGVDRSIYSLPTSKIPPYRARQAFPARER
ncbi:hypothetical protein F4693_002645 [Sphingomonas endophytica]|uniref:Uncharacterized protein n=1 Tax=Sphingomonas endophytica TaxID=869719 RepID=A0A7X0JE73_9SPHN|nr:hypothetical protein [Sphingomonas endophytica]